MAEISADTQTFLLTKAHLSADSVDLLVNVVGWAGKAASVVGMVSAGVDIINMLMGPKPDPALEALKRIEQQLDTIAEQQLYQALWDRRSELTEMKSTAVGAATTLLAVHDSSYNRRAELVADQLELRKNLLRLLDKNYNMVAPSPRIYELISGQPAPGWMQTGVAVPRYQMEPHGLGPSRIGKNGLLEYSIHRWLPTGHPNGSKETVGWYGRSSKDSQALVSTKPSDSQAGEYELPVGIRPDVFGWDGRLSLPLILYTFVVYEGVTRAIEPYYRATGYYHQDFLAIRNLLSEYLQAWKDTLLTTRGMPGSYGDPPGWPPASLGFQTWPVGAVDPVSGAAVFSDHGWSIDEQPPGDSWRFVSLMKAPEEVKMHAVLTTAALKKLQAINGMPEVDLLRDRLGNLATATTSSPTLQVRAEAASSTRGELIWERPTTATTYSGPGTTADGVTYRGVERLYATQARLPITVQGNPGLHHTPNVAQVSESEVTFGYRVATGGLESPLFNVPLRTRPGEPGLYHTAKPGVEGLRQLPYDQEWRSLLGSFNSWRTYRYQDGRLYGRFDQAWRELRVDARVTAAAETIPGDPLLDLPDRGQLLVDVKLANGSGGRRTAASFQFACTVTEILGVDVAGAPVGDVSEGPITFNEQGSLMVDCLEVVLPDAFYAADAKAREEAAENLRNALAQWLHDKAHSRPAVDEWGFPWPLRDPGLPDISPLPPWDPWKWLQPEPHPGPFPDPTDWLGAVRGALRRGAGKSFVAELSALMKEPLTPADVDEGLTLLLPQRAGNL